MRISLIVSLVSNRKISDVIEQVLKTQRITGQGTYETWSRQLSYCYFWAMTPARANLSVRQLPHGKFWIFEGHFPGRDPAAAHSVGLLLSHIDSLSRIIAIGKGQTWYFDHFNKVFKRNGNLGVCLTPN
jgi:hypothetical protein